MHRFCGFASGFPSAFLKTNPWKFGTPASSLTKRDQKEERNENCSASNDHRLGNLGRPLRKAQNNKSLGKHQNPQQRAPQMKLPITSPS